MASITLSVPNEVREQMKSFPDVNWSGFVRICVESKVKRLSWKQKMLQKLDSEKEFDRVALEIGDKIKEGMWKRYKKEGW